MSHAASNPFINEVGYKIYYIFYITYIYIHMLPGLAEDSSLKYHLQTDLSELEQWQ